MFPENKIFGFGSFCLSSSLFLSPPSLDLNLLLPPPACATPSCVHSKCFRVCRQQVKMLKACERVARTHGDVLSVHTEAFWIHTEASSSVPQNTARTPTQSHNTPTQHTTSRPQPTNCTPSHTPQKRTQHHISQCMLDVSPLFCGVFPRETRQKHVGTHFKAHREKHLLHWALQGTIGGPTDKIEWAKAELFSGHIYPWWAPPSSSSSLLLINYHSVLPSFLLHLLPPSLSAPSHHPSCSSVLFSCPPPASPPARPRYPGPAPVVPPLGVTPPRNRFSRRSKCWISLGRRKMNLDSSVQPRTRPPTC